MGEDGGRLTGGLCFAALPLLHSPTLYAATRLVTTRPPKSTRRIFGHTPGTCC